MGSSRFHFGLIVTTAPNPRLALGSPLPEETIGALIEQIGARIAANAPRDFFQPPILRGHNGEIAPALGAGLLPLFASYAPNLGSLMKSPNVDAMLDSATA